METSPFHADEQAAQRRAGVHPHPGGIRPFMPDQHRAFFPLLRYLFVSVPDENGWPIPAVLSGSAGFVHAPSPTMLRVDTLPARTDPVAAGFRPGNDIGILGLDLATRRRNRANGRIGALDGSGFAVDVTQSFGNCAQYIQTRTIQTDRRDVVGESPSVTDGIDDDARRLIRASDTLFVASRSRAGVTHGGLDMSHRGGRPGFARVDGDTLIIPDFKGNRFFNTLGNLLGDNRAGLLFIDFEAGDVLQAIGTATIEWDSDSVPAPQGAQRFWRVDVARSWWRRGALPFTWTFDAFAPTTLATGVW